MDVSFGQLGSHSLVCTRSENRYILSVSQQGSRIDTICNQYIRDIIYFLTVLSIATQVELQLLAFHIRIVTESAFLRILTTLLVTNRDTVYFGFLTNVHFGFTHDLLVAVFEHRSDLQLTLASEFLGRESTRDIRIHYTTNESQRIGIHFDFLWFVHNLRAGCHQH